MPLPSTELVLEQGYWWPKGAETRAARYIGHREDAARGFQHCKRRRGCLQAGGHVGIWPIYLSDHFERVLTFEPEPGNYEALARNVQDRDIINVQYLAGLLGAKPGCGWIGFNERNSGGHKCTYGVDKPDDVRFAVPTLVFCLDALLGAEALPSFPVVDFICLDVEGAEFHTLMGAISIIVAHKPVIMLEERDHGKRFDYTLDDLHAWLGSFGYREVDRIHSDRIYAHQH